MPFFTLIFISIESKLFLYVDSMDNITIITAHFPDCLGLREAYMLLPVSNDFFFAQNVHLVIKGFKDPKLLCISCKYSREA